MSVSPIPRLTHKSLGMSAFVACSICANFRAASDEYTGLESMYVQCHKATCICTTIQ